MTFLFFDGYTYGDFVGCYKPVPAVDDTYIYGDGKKLLDIDNLANVKPNQVHRKNGITYSYEPGAFIRIYVEAVNHPNQNYVLIIEEINRAKAANVFGELFQLLDRNDDGTGKYKITPSLELETYLFEKCDEYNGYLSLPSNLYIWATMNAADQGVKSLDAAFLRRWSLYWKNVYDAKKSRKICLYHSGRAQEVEWNKFREFINNKIKAYGNISEDKLIGEWYFSNGELAAIKKHTMDLLAPKDTSEMKNDGSEAYNPLIYKLCTYLRQDVARMAPEQMFVKGALMSEIINLYDYSNGVVPDINQIFEASPIEWNDLFQDASAVLFEEEDNSDEAETDKDLEKGEESEASEETSSGE